MKLLLTYIFCSLATSSFCQHYPFILKTKYNECTAWKSDLCEVKTSGVKLTDSTTGLMIEVKCKDYAEGIRSKVAADSIALVATKDTLLLANIIRDSAAFYEHNQFYVDRIFVIPLTQSESNFLVSKDVISIILYDNFFKTHVNIIVEGKCRKMLKTIIK